MAIKKPSTSWAFLLALNQAPISMDAHQDTNPNTQGYKRSATIANEW
jgi:arginase family enzyme